MPLDVRLAVDVDVGWQVGLTTLPGKTPPGDAFPLTDPDNVTHVFEAEYNALMSDPEGLRVLKDAAANALMLRHVDIGTEFYIKDFGSAFYRVALCYDCPGKLECTKCNKTGYVTEVFQPYLVGLCFVKDASEQHAPVDAEPAAGQPAPPTPPVARRRPPKRWSWSVPAAALATMVMAISIGLRFMYESEGPKPQPQPPGVVALAESPPAGPAPVAQAAGVAAVSPPPPAAAPSAPPPASQTPAAAEAGEAEPEARPAIPDEPPRKPAVPPMAAPPPPAPPATAPAALSPAAPAPAAVGAAVAKSAPVIRLQTALTQLDLYHGPINGVLDGPTHQALSQLLSMVPAQVRAQYGLRSAALAEAAARHEFPLKQK